MTSGRPLAKASSYVLIAPFELLIFYTQHLTSENLQRYQKLRRGRKMDETITRDDKLELIGGEAMSPVRKYGTCVKETESRR